MKNNRFSRLIVVSVTFFILIFFSFYFIGSNRGKVINNSYISTPISKVDSLIGLPFNFLKNLKSDISSLFNVYEENKALKEKNAELSDSLLSVTSLEKENESLRQSLDISEKYNHKSLISSNVITRSTVSWFDELILSVGKKQGVSESMLAINNGNLVGKVVDVSSGSSTVQLLTNSELAHRIPVKINTSSSVVYGIISTYDSEQELVIVNQLNNNSEIAVNDGVFTSGLDGDSVAEIPVGVVKHVSDDKKTIYVELNADFNTIDSVTLVGNN